MKRYVALYLFFAAASALAQPPGALPDSVVRDIAKDLAEMQKAIDDARRKQEAATFAQFLKGQGVAAITVTTASAPIRAGASDGARSIASAKQGMKYRVIDKVDNWYAVALDRPIGGLASGWLKAADAVPAATVPAMYAAGSQNATASEGIYRQLVEQASRFRRAYEQNPYVTVSGFDVGFPLTLTLSFQFKESGKK
jgi:hypothetical protein